MVAGQAGKGSSPRPVDKKKYDEGYLRAYGLCKNSNCHLSSHCYRFLRTIPFHPTYGDWKPDKDGKCSFYVKCSTKKDFERLENG